MNFWLSFFSFLVVFMLWMDSYSMSCEYTVLDAMKSYIYIYRRIIDDMFVCHVNTRIFI